MQHAAHSNDLYYYLIIYYFTIILLSLLYITIFTMYFT